MSKDKPGVEFTKELRSAVERMTTFQRRYCEYRGRGLNQPDSAQKAGSKAADRQALGRVGYNLETSVKGAREYIAYLQAVKAEAACVDELEIIEGLRNVVKESMDNGKFNDANKALELLGSYIGMFGKNKVAGDQTTNQGNTNTIKNNVNAFKDEGETIEDRTKRLGTILNIVTNNESHKD